MSYPRFFVDLESIKGNIVNITGESARHISKSLRMKPNERIVVCDGNSNEYECVLESFTEESVIAKIEDMRRSVTEPKYEITVYQASPKGDKTDSIVQKGVELGATSIVLFLSDRCIARYDRTSAEKKITRWQKIANEASKQSGRGCVPIVRWLPDLKSVIEECSETDSAFMCYEDEETLGLKEYLSNIKDAESISFIIGPEGGFSKEEAELCKSKGIATVGLGKRILRTETASSFVLSCISYESEL